MIKNENTDYYLIISAIIPATLLFVMSVILSVKIISDGFIFPTDVHFLLTSALGIFGYLGLYFLLFKLNNKKPILVSIFLAGGITSLIWFVNITTDNFWYSLFGISTVKEFGQSLLYLWPNIVSIYFLIKTLKKLIITHR